MGLYWLPIRPLVGMDHFIEGEVCFDVGAAASAGDVVQVIDQRGGVGAFTLFNQETCFAMAYDLFHRTTAIGDHGSARRHRFNRCQTKGFIPLDGEEQPERLAHDLPQGQPLQLPQEGYAFARFLQFWPDAFCKLLAVIDAARDYLSIARHGCSLDGRLDALLCCDTPCK